MKTEYSHYLDFAVNTAKEAGALLMAHYGKAHKMTYKLRTNFKTEVDDASERLIRAAIQGTFPDHRIWGEEFAAKTGTSEYVWVIDPLDGTTPYALGFNNNFSVCMGLAHGRKLIVGVIYMPKDDLLFSAIDGEQTTLNGELIQVAEDPDINHAAMGVDDGKLDRLRLIPYLRRLKAKDGVNVTLSHGCASVPLCMVACGRMSAYLALALEPWDVAASAPIIRGAGGTITDIHGLEWQLPPKDSDPVSVFAAGPALHKNLTKFLNGVENDPR